MELSQIQEQYLTYKTNMYLKEHPEQTYRYARKAARNAWKNKMRKYDVTTVDGQTVIKRKQKAVTNGDLPGGAK